MLGADILAPGSAGDRMFFKQAKAVARDGEPRSGASLPCCCVLLAAMCAIGFSTEPAAAAGKKPIDWQHATTVEDQASADADNPVCKQLSSTLSKRIASIKAFQAAIEKSETGPPSSVKSALEDMFGTRQPDAKSRELVRKIKVERKAVDELNEMMRSSRCAPVDIDAMLAKHKADDRGAPEVPKALPDDLVRSPRQY